MNPAIIAECGRDMARVVGFLMRLARGEFYGTVSLKFERGSVTLVRTEQAIKPDELEGVRVVR